MTPVTCRVCDSGCGLLATVHGGRVTALAPDPDHPVSRGYACRKGTGFLAGHDHPDRVVRPLLRRHGALVPVSWGDALAEIGGRLRVIRDAHGPGAVGTFLGNATAYNLGAVLMATGLTRGLGTAKTYSALTLDNSQQYAVIEAVFGNAMRTFLADYAGSDLVVLVGTDPVSSQPTQGQSQPGAVPEIVRAGRQGRLVVLDPRTSATARVASTHLRPRPGSDAAVLAWLVREASGRVRDAWLDPADVAVVRAAVAGFDRDRAARDSGIAAHDLQALADRLFAAERPLVWGGLGVLLGPHGTVGWWLVLALQALLGGIDRPGGWVFPRGAVDVPRMWSWLGVKARDEGVRSRIGGWPAMMGTLPSATLADDVLTDGDRLRALIVVGGNPANSLPDTARAREALGRLDLLVCVDLFVSDTATLAHAVLPAADFLERTDLPIHVANQRPVAHVQLERAVVPPRGEARADADILADLAAAAGVPLFGSRLADAAVRRLGPVGVARAAVALFGRVSGRSLLGPRGAVAPHEPPGWFRARHRARLAVPWVLRLLDGVAPPPAGTLLVTSVRPVATMNSWLHAGVDAPVARMHPEDLAALGDPARVRIEGASAAEVAVVADPGVLPGVVVLPYGWGHLPGAVGGGGAGVSANLLVGTAALEPGSGQPISNGAAVRVVALDPGADPGLPC